MARGLAARLPPPPRPDAPSTARSAPVPAACPGRPPTRTSGGRATPARAGGAPSASPGTRERRTPRGPGPPPAAPRRALRPAGRGCLHPSSRAPPRVCTWLCRCDTRSPSGSSARAPPGGPGRGRAVRGGLPGASAGRGTAAGTSRQDLSSQAGSGFEHRVRHLPAEASRSPVNGPRRSPRPWRRPGLCSGPQAPGRGHWR